MSMRTPWGIGVVVGLALAALPGTASAQPFDSAIDVQTFEYAIGPKTFFTVSDGDIAAPKQLAFDALLTFLTKPFTVYNFDPSMPDTVGSERTTVVNNLTALQLTGAYGLTDKIQVGVNLPIMLLLQGDGLDPKNGTGACGMASTGTCLSVSGLGDMLVEGKYRLMRKGAIKIAAIGGLTLPTSIGSDGSQFIGDDLPTARVRGAVQFDEGKLSLGMNAGVLLRKSRTIYDSTIGSQLMWGIGAAYRITDRFSVIGESYGRAGLPDFSLDASPLEAEGGLRLHATSAVAVVLGGGAGLVKGIGSPSSRFFLSVGYAPDIRDTDEDRVGNARDKCPLIPEDFDGYEDGDGCPEDDNDGDRRPDAQDKCPAVAEDLDGFDDDDGCPELDNDGDKLPDLQDKCPSDAEDGKQPYPTDGCPANKRDSDGDTVMDATDTCPLEEEDVDGFEDGDGCPEADNDFDGVADGADRCPLCPEDKDGVQDDDGCPDLDNDKDGIADARDACPLEAETINGVNDEDGCADTGGMTVAAVDGDRLVIGKVPPMDSKGLTRAGVLLVDQIALVMVQHDEVTRWLVAVSSPKALDAAKLADAIKARLIAKGVPEGAFQVLGAAGPAKIGGVVQERADEVAPVCPASREVKQRPETIKADAAPSTVPAVAPDPVSDLEMDADVSAPVAPVVAAAPPAPADQDDDGIIDAADKCPDQGETKNSFQDDDGCPDTVPTALKKFSGSVQGVNFKSGSAQILPASLKILDSAAKALAAFPDLKVEVQGHTDDVPPGKGGRFPDNTALSQARAESVMEYLKGTGIDAARLTAKGFGDAAPVNVTAKLKGSKLKAARTKNRRVEFKLLAQ